MMTQNEIKLLRGFLIESKMTQKEFSKEAGVCERTLRTAIKTGKVSDKTWNKILDEIMAETIQIKLIKPEEIIVTPAFIYKTLKVLCIATGVFALLVLLNSIFG